MLQINTGKLFSRGVGRTNNLTGVLYTNLVLPYDYELATEAGKLRPTDRARGTQTVIYEVEERIESGEDGPGLLVSNTCLPYLRDFAILTSFALNGIVVRDKVTVDTLAADPAAFKSRRPLREYVRTYFDVEVRLTEDEAGEYASFVVQLLALERRYFLIAMRAIRAFVSGMNILNDDPALAYALLVSAIESIAAKFKDYDSSWEDIDERKRNPIDAALTSASDQVADGVREAMVNAEHGSIARRYRALALNSISEDYFRSGEALIGRPLARYDMEEALKAAYQIRSRYLHNQHELPDEILNPHGHWETVNIERRPTLTFQGLSRMARHIIKVFVAQSPSISNEPYDYMLEQPGVMRVNLASRYWIGEKLQHPREARMRFEGLMGQIISIESKEEGGGINDLRPVLADVERLIPEAEQRHRPAMMMLHALFNGVVVAELKSDGCEEFLEKHADEMAATSSEALAVRTWFGTTDGWEIDDHQIVHNEYFRQRPRRNGLHLPRSFEAAISLTLAERYRLGGDAEEARRLIGGAVENHPACPALQQLEIGFDPAQPIDWRATLFPREKDADEAGQPSEDNEEIEEEEPSED